MSHATIAVERRPSTTSGTETLPEYVVPFCKLSLDDISRAGGKNAGLLGGSDFEPVESNPMIGFRGASRYYDERYQAGPLLSNAPPSGEYGKKWGSPTSR